jgi:hypothetical protein
MSTSRYHKVPLLDAVDSWLREKGVSPEVRELLEEHSYSSWLEIGRLSFNSANEVVEVNTDPQNHAVWSRGLLIVGSGLNGDPIVVSSESGRAGYLCHDELWESDTVPDLASIYCELPESLGQFYLSAATLDAYPVDFYEAEAMCGRG